MHRSLWWKCTSICTKNASSPTVGDMIHRKSVCTCCAAVLACGCRFDCCAPAPAEEVNTGAVCSVSSDGMLVAGTAGAGAGFLAAAAARAAFPRLCVTGMKPSSSSVSPVSWLTTLSGSVSTTTTPIDAHKHTHVHKQPSVSVMIMRLHATFVRAQNSRVKYSLIQYMYRGDHVPLHAETTI